MAKGNDDSERRERNTSDFPKHSLIPTLRIPDVIEQKNGGRPLPPTDLAIGLGVSPGSSDFRILLSSSIKYGLSQGSYNRERISVTDLGRRLASPISSDDKHQAMLTAALNPPTFRRIYESLKGKKIPDDVFFQNMLVRDFDVPRDHAAKCVKIFRENAESVGLIRTASSGLWLAAEAIPSSTLENLPEGNENNLNEPLKGDTIDSSRSNGPRLPNTDFPSSPSISSQQKEHRVFISHGKNMEIVGQIKELLKVAEMPYEIAVETEATAIPVPEKIFSAMRKCTAAIICVTGDGSPSGNDVVVNQNVLIEIGAAFVLYDKKVILVWDTRLQIPSNLQGLYRCEIEGKELSFTKAMRLLEMLKSFKKEESIA